MENIDYETVVFRVLQKRNQESIIRAEYQVAKQQVISASQFFHSLIDAIDKLILGIEEREKRKYNKENITGEDLLSHEAITGFIDLIPAADGFNEEVVDFITYTVGDLYTTKDYAWKAYNIIKNEEIQLAELAVGSSEIENPLNTTTKDYTTTIWFRVGLYFANGEMDNLIKQYDSNYTKIANSLGNKSFRPYISDSIGKTSSRDKNIYSSHDKISKIYRYCEEKGITMTSDFIRIYQSKQQN